MYLDVNGNPWKPFLMLSALNDKMAEKFSIFRYDCRSDFGGIPSQSTFQRAIKVNLRDHEAASGVEWQSR
jgi:hypothetical protein